MANKNGFLGSIDGYSDCFVLFQPIYSLRWDKKKQFVVMHPDIN